MELNLPFVKARRVIGVAFWKAEAPLRRAERVATCAMEFMMIFDGIDDGEEMFLDGFWRLFWLEEGKKLLGRKSLIRITASG